MKSIVVDESLSSMNLQFCSRENQLLQLLQQNEKPTSIELCGLAINIASFSHLLKRVDFDVIVDRLSLTHIIKSKAEPATARIMKLLELVSSYSFNLYYLKGKDMILSNFLSRQKQ